jgi:hypothetical protein
LVSSDETRLAQTSGDVTLVPGQNCGYNPAENPPKPQYINYPDLKCKNPLTGLTAPARMVRIDHYTTDAKLAEGPKTQNGDGKTYLPVLYVRGNLQADRLIWADQSINAWPSEIGGYKIEGCAVSGDACNIKKNVDLTISWTIFDAVQFVKPIIIKDKFGNDVVYNVWGSKFTTKITGDQGVFDPLGYLPMNPTYTVLSPQRAAGTQDQKNWTKAASGIKPSYNCSYTATINSDDLKGSCVFRFPSDDGNPKFKLSIEID